MPRLILLLACLAVAGVTTPRPSMADPHQPYPNRPIRMIVPFPPGGAADVTARTLAQAMSTGIGQPVAVENRAGAGGAIGTEAAARAAADGYTVLLVDRGVLGMAPSLYQTPRFDPKTSFAYVGIVTEGPYVLVVDPAIGVGTMQDIVARAKSAPKPMAYGSFGVGSMAHLNIEALKAALGIDLQHIPYKGSAEAVNAVANGEVQVALVAPPAALEFVRAKRIKALVVGAAARVPQLPDVPTLAESGYPADLLLPTFFALAAPAGTPAPIVGRLNAEMRKAVHQPETASRLVTMGLIPVGSDPEQAAATVARDVVRFGAIAARVGITPQ
ncbi:MAG: Bug family tripartite tricarboxylate transporter substrate binding protein [Acetobacteraceae bacterium]